MFCKYSNIFGEVAKGVHQYRIYDIAIVDVIMTIIAASIIKYYYKQYDFYKILLLLFLMGIILHRVFCVRTTIDKLLFTNHHHYDKDILR